MSGLDGLVIRHSILPTEDLPWAVIMQPVNSAAVSGIGISPTGIVEGMEFWATTDTYILDSNRNYFLLDTVRPSQGNTFTFGTEVSITNDTLSSGNLYVKTRGINSQTVGPFTSPAGFVYTPIQTTNNIDENTTVTSTAGLATALGALTLLNNLDGLFSGNTASGGLFKKIFDLFNDETGTDILGDASSPDGLDAMRWDGSRKYIQEDEPTGANPLDIWFQANV